MPFADGAEEGGGAAASPRPDFRLELSARENSGLDDDALPSVSTQNSTLGSSLSLPTQRSAPKVVDELPVLLPLRHEMCITSEPRFVTCNRAWYGPCERRPQVAGTSKHSFRPNGLMKKLQRDKSSDDRR